MSETYGSAKFDNGTWLIEAEPHVAMVFKRIFKRVNSAEVGVMKMSSNPEICDTLKWFCLKYPLKFDQRAHDAVCSGAATFKQNIMRMRDIIGTNYKPPRFKLAKALRMYQAQLVEIYHRQGHILCGDDMGLGKTVQGIASFVMPDSLPGIVVCPPSIRIQWSEKLTEFAPQLRWHIISKVEPYRLPVIDNRRPDVLICSYHALNSWGTVFAEYGKSIIFDEGHELRRNESEKYAAAKFLCERIRRKMLMSGTPVMNYGGEVFNIIELLRPGYLGTKEEFHREWCRSNNGKWIVKEPVALGLHLRENYLYIRRTKAEVGRELPPVSIVVQPIDADTQQLAKIEGSAVELARIIVAKEERNKGDRMNAAGQFDNALRQATGLAKAPFVAEFAKMIVDSGERLLLAGWHRAVYNVWQENFEKAGVPYSMFTGTESPTAKKAAHERFVRGDARVMIISNRAGTGLDGLQGACKNVVFGELDWSPGYMKQLIARVYRDGQPFPVTVYYLVSDHGLDPFMTEVLGVKKAQMDGIHDPNKPIIEPLDVQGRNIRKLAESFLARGGFKFEPRALQPATVSIVAPPKPAAPVNFAIRRFNAGVKFHAKVG